MYLRILSWLVVVAVSSQLSAEELRMRRLDGGAHFTAKALPRAESVDKETFEIILDDNEPDVAYFPSNANTLATFAMFFELPSAPVTVDEVAFCITRDGSDSALAVAVGFWDDDGPGGEPGTLLGTEGAAFSGVPAFPGVGLATVDLTGAGVTLPDDTVYLSVSWDPSTDNDFAFCGDRDGTVVHPGYFQAGSGAWSTIQSAFGDTAYNALFIRGTFTSVGGGGCVPDATTLCLPADDRFKVSVFFETTQGGGRMGDAQAIPLDPLGLTLGGIFAFVNPANPEFLVKVLDGCAVNGHYWVFYAATTNIGFELTVEDTQTPGAVQVYTNPDIHPADTVTDTRAFATCP